MRFRLHSWNNTTFEALVRFPQKKSVCNNNVVMCATDYDYDIWWKSNKIFFYI